MKRLFLACLLAVPVLGPAPGHAITPVPLVLSKEGGGRITRESLSLELKALPCDATQALLPDGSRLVSDRLTATYDDKGIGFFRGVVKFVTPDAKVVLVGGIQGTIGLAPPGPENAACLAPGRWQGTIAPMVATSPNAPGNLTKPDRAGPPAPDPLGPAIVSNLNQPNAGEPMWLIHFVAEEVKESASPVPLFRVRLEGLVLSTPTDPGVKVIVQPNKWLYGYEEPIEAAVTNLSRVNIRSFAFYSYCTIIQLQHNTEGVWKPVAGCPLTGGPAITIKAGETYKVTLPPPSADWPKRYPGQYRLALTFEPVLPDGTTPEARTVFSPPFTIKAPEPPTGRVVLASAKPQYSLIEPIIAMLKNGMSVPVRIYDQKSFCTLVELQKRVGDTWIMMYGCPLDSLPRPVDLKPGEALTLRMPREATTDFKWESGEYRFKTAFAPLRADGSYPAEEIPVVSDVFRIGEPAPPTGKVLIKPEKLAYEPGELVAAYVTNGWTVPLQVRKNQSFCTILRLEALLNGVWTPVYNCHDTSATTQTIAAGETVRIGVPEVTIPEFRYRPGTYRLALTFVPLTSNTTTSAPITTYSPTFTIGSNTPTGPITLAPGQPAYEPGQNIVAVIRNVSRQKYVARTSGSWCTIVTLYRSLEGQWFKQGICQSFWEGPPVPIEPGAELKVELPPGVKPADLPPGIYRMDLEYWTLDAAGNPTGSPMLAKSTTFSVNGVRGLVSDAR